MDDAPISISGESFQMFSQNFLNWCYRAEEDFETSVLFKRHMQSGHGNVYNESLGLFISIPLASLWARIFSNCRFKDFHLFNK